ncbi:2-C-methyl-D-erythritol 4-phosphate cytidylyltransferase, partial [Paracoccus sp. PXZ]
MGYCRLRLLAATKRLSGGDCLGPAADLNLAAMTIPATYAAIITAAGRGTRAGDGPPKQWRALAGQTVL